MGHPRKSGTWRTRRSPAARRAQLVEENRKPQVLEEAAPGAPGGTQIRLTVIVKPIRPRRLRLDWMMVLFSKGPACAPENSALEGAIWHNSTQVSFVVSCDSLSISIPKAMILCTFDVIATLD